MLPPHTTCVLRSRFFLLHLRQDDACTKTMPVFAHANTQVSSKPFEFVPETKRATRNYWKKKYYYNATTTPT
jgi:hypothetical protein